MRSDFDSVLWRLAGSADVRSPNCSADVRTLTVPPLAGVFSMDEDSLSRDCEPFFESDGEEESTDGEGDVVFPV